MKCFHMLSFSTIEALKSNFLASNVANAKEKDEILENGHFLFLRFMLLLTFSSP